MMARITKAGAERRVEARGVGVFKTVVPVEGGTIEVEGDKNKALAFGLELRGKKREYLISLLEEHVDVVRAAVESLKCWNTVREEGLGLSGNWGRREGDLLPGRLE